MSDYLTTPLNRLVSEQLAQQRAIQARTFHPSGQWSALPQRALDQSIITRFEAIAARYPDRPAVQMEDQCLTYAALNVAANQVAHAVLAQRCDRARPVILLFDHTPTAVIAMLGVLKAGSFYTPFTPTQPPARLRQKAVDSQAELLLTDQQHLALATQINGSGAALLAIDQLTPAQLVGTSTNPNLALRADDHALLLYTSGSTGEPKGILLTHQALLHRVKRQVDLVHLGCADRCSCVHTYDAIAGLRDLFCPLLCGAAACLFNPRVHALSALPGWVEREQITVLGFVTPTFRQLLNQLTPTTAFAQVRLICIGGDTLYRQDVEHYRQLFPPTCVLYNSLGATETAGGFCYYLFDHECALPADPLPVGYPMADMQITIVDEAGQPLAPYASGEIALTTAYLAQGYWRQATQTAVRFRPAPLGRTYLTGDRGLLQADGCLVHLGRQDAQVKVHGYRVEIGEIEYHLLSHPAIQEVAVVHSDKEGEAQLVAFYVTKAEMRATAQMLRQWLLTSLPAPMVPTQFVWLDALPLTPSGKIDRRALLLPERAKPIGLATAYAAPRTPLEERLAQLWAEVLGVQAVGIADHFLDLGGNSLHAAQIQTRLVSQLQIDIPTRLFFACATIAELAMQITQQQATQIDQAALVEMLAVLETEQ